MADSDSEAEEVYEDAVEPPISPTQQLSPSPGCDIGSLEQSVNETSKAMDAFLNNRFNEAMLRLQSKADSSVYHALGFGTVLFTKSILTLERNDIEFAMEALKSAVDVCHKRRKIVGMSKMMWRPNYNHFTEEEVHAELCYAECLLQIAMLTFFEDQSLVNFVKGGLRIRSCYQSYKECMNILNNRNWENANMKKHFESGVRMGIGTFNLMISQLPSRILKLLEFVGFSGNRATGLKELEVSSSLREGLRSPLSSLILMTYHTFVSCILSTGDGDIDFAEKLLNEMLPRYPKGAFFLLFVARIKQIRGAIDEAVEVYQECISVQEEWKQVHNICYWEMLWCHSVKCDWEGAAKYADILRQGCRWSPATYTYQYAVYLYMQQAEDGKEGLTEEIEQLLNQVPGLKQRLAGKSLPIEKFVIKKSQKYFDQSGRLMLPALELLYVWNGFSTLGGSSDLLNPMLELVQKKLDDIKDAKDKEEVPLDDYCLLTVLKGMCLRHLGNTAEAEECFKEIPKHEKRIVDDTYLVPFSVAELGFLCMEKKQPSEAKDFLHKAKQQYHGYQLESLLHFRIHSAMRQIKNKDQYVCPTSMTPPASSTPPLDSPLPSPSPSPTHAVNSNGTVANSSFHFPSNGKVKGKVYHCTEDGSFAENGEEVQTRL